MRCYSSEAIDVRHILNCLSAAGGHGIILEKRIEGLAIMGEQQQFDSSYVSFSSSAVVYA